MNTQTKTISIAAAMGLMLGGVLVLRPGGAPVSDSDSGAPNPSTVPVRAASAKTSVKPTAHRPTFEILLKPKAPVAESQTDHADLATDRAAWMEEFRRQALAGDDSQVREMIHSAQDLDPTESAARLREAAHWLAATDSARAAAVVNGMGASLSQRAFVSDLVKGFADGDATKAGSFLNALEDGKLRKHAHQAFARDLAREDIEATVDWIANIPDAGDQIAAGEGLMFSWTQSDLQGALDWAGLLEPSGFRDGVYLKTSKMVALKDPATATRWASQFPTEDVRNQAMTFALHRWAERDPAAAADWASQNGDLSSDASELDTVLSVWSDNNSTAAESWLNSRWQQSEGVPN